jgi:hypothetical protein
LNLLNNVKAIPYNSSGYGLVRSACMDAINAGLNFAMYAPGSISSEQQAAVNYEAGTSISQLLQNQGWSLQILDAPSASRAARTSPPMKFWYLDRGSIQKININSVSVQ